MAITEKDKAAQRSTLIFQLGKLLAPLSELAERPSPPISSEYMITAARGLADCERWRVEVNEFATINGYNFAQLAKEIRIEPQNLFNMLTGLAKMNSSDADRQIELRNCLGHCIKMTLDAIDRLPIEWTTRLHEAQTPYSVYLKVRDALSTAKKRIHYFDRYLDTNFFNVYMRDLNRSIEIRLITTKGNANYGTSNTSAVSRIAASEFTNFQLIECDPANLHDRNLRIDDIVFHLGTSIKDAGTQPTNFSLADATSTGHAILDGIIAKGAIII